MTAVRALAFGDLETGVWGAAWMPDAVAAPSIALGTGSGAAVVSATVDGSDVETEWRLRAPGADLVVSPAGEPVREGGAQDGLDQLCRLSGHLELDGEAHSVDCLGWQAARRLAVEPDRLESFRQVSAWFEPGEGVALLALRPHKARGQDSDVIAAAVLEPDLAGTISDPRLSTTYRDDGNPTRAGIELWIVEEGGDGAEPNGAAEPEQAGGREYPRRAAGEALGPQADWELNGFHLHAELFRWHSRGRDGAGVYLLGVRAG